MTDETIDGAAPAPAPAADAAPAPAPAVEPVVEAVAADPSAKLDEIDARLLKLETSINYIANVYSWPRPDDVPTPWAW